ncbi:hypothetical protein NIES932_19580 [Raphidiopsis curvata NIES-932]|uniref:glycosyltransferase family 39 protein n=1 Tax=Cylindrospermopsis raciborskii TaxID=77022 RepID=UPI000B61EA34|nr:hypothetical protein NIES932_19580 [Raphidiopsis curvata NIES-932]
MPNLELKTKTPTWLKIAVVVLIGISIFCRWVSLDKKIYCCDENWTSVAISGHTLVELQKELSEHEGIIPINNFQKYQHISPEKHVSDTVNYLITSDPQHPPLYYIMVRLWAQIFGDSPTGIRSLSTIISLLIFPGVFWICLELFESGIVAWIAMALIAVSPLQLYFAQEARQYALWMVEILISSTALLRSIRKENTLSWVLYSLTLILGLYTHLLTGLMIISHGIYVIIQQQFRLTKTLINYIIYTIIALLIFLPWLIVFINHLDTGVSLTSGYGVRYTDSPLELIAVFLVRVTRTFFDLGLAKPLGFFSYFSDEGALYYTLISLIFGLFLISYLIFCFCKDIKNETYLFLFCLGGFPSILLILYDIILGGSRSIQVRYELPLYICLEIAIAYILSFAFPILQEKTWRRKIAQLMMVLLIFSGLVSDVKFFQSQNSWTQSGSTFIMETIQAINEADSPLLVINNAAVHLGGILALTHYSPGISLLTNKDVEPLVIPENYNQIFFVDNNSHLFRKLKDNQNYCMKTIQKITTNHSVTVGGLWRFEKKV